MDEIERAIADRNHKMKLMKQYSASGLDWDVLTSRRKDLVDIVVETNIYFGAILKGN